MRITARHWMLAAGLAGLAGCGSSESEAGDPGNGVVANLQAMAPVPYDPTNPYAPLLDRSKAAMAAAVGIDLSETFVKKMIVHHRGGIALAKLVLGQDPTPDVRALAEQTIARQQREIETLRSLAKDGKPAPEAAAAFQGPAMQMHEAMRSAGGANPSETWIRKMIEHHRGGVAMAEIVAAEGTDPKVRAFAKATAEDQRRDIARLEQMLGAAPGPDIGAPIRAGEPDPAGTPPHA
ncbi:DUF305 domain-containing protein [Sphingomonas parva]|nr:DUF305 domain-containing protein [Sphingomonas parva]